MTYRKSVPKGRFFERVVFDVSRFYTD